MLLRVKQKKTERIVESQFASEKEMQDLCELNLKSLLGLDFVATQFKIMKYRFDTLAYDPINRSFVIIEYKNTVNFSVVDQGIAYLNTLMDNKAEFVLAFNEKFRKEKQKKEFAWDNTKVIFIAPEYTKYQKDSIYNNLPIKLYKITKYKEIISFEEIESNIFNKYEYPSKVSGKLSNEIKVYDEEQVFSKIKNEKLREIYHSIDDYILSFQNINSEIKKLYKVYKKNNENVISLEPYPGVLYLFFNCKYKAMLKYDKERLGDNVSKKGHHSVGEYRIKIRDDSSIGYIKDLIKKFYKSN